MELIQQNWKKGVLCLAITVAVVVLVIIPGQCFAKRDISSMYSEKTLMRLKERYTDSISWNFDKVIKPALTEHELAAVDKVELDLPFRIGVGDPFLCFAKVERDGRQTIVMPIFSIKFLDDFMTAAAWLRHNTHTTETLSEYISMLKYREAIESSSGRCPTPLEALNIPPDALEDKKVNELAQNFLKSTVVYLLSREIGFLNFSRSYTSTRGQRQRSPQQMQQQMPERGWGARSEQKQLWLDCDAFAMEVMRRMSVPPEGLSSYLLAQTYWTQKHIDFDNEASYSRYLSRPPKFAMFSERLYQIGNLMVKGMDDYIRQEDDKSASASQIERDAGEILELSNILEDKSVQWKIKRKALTQSIEDLKRGH